MPTPAPTTASTTTASGSSGSFNGGLPLSTAQIQSMRQQMNITPTAGNSAPSSSSNPQDQWAKFDQLQNPPAPAPSGPSDPFNPLNNTGKGGNYFSEVGDSFNQANQQVSDSANTVMDPSKSLGDRSQALLHDVSGAASEISAPLAPIFKPLSDIIQTAGQGYANAGTALGLPKVQNAIDSFANSKFGGQVEQGAQDVSDVANIAGTVAGAKGLVDKIPDTINAFNSTVKNTAQGVKTTLTPSDAKTTQSIVDNYNKAVKPSVAGKTNAGSLAKANSNIVSGVNSILANKDNLSFTDKDGNEVTGKTPENLQDLSSAVAQTKSSLFNQFNDLQKQAGASGLKIDTSPIGDQLDKVIGNEALQVSHPDAIQYAKEMQGRLQNPDGTYKQFTPEVTQEIIKNYNSSLEAFYKNPSYDNASKAAIDAGVASTLRQGIDDAVEKSTGGDAAKTGQYQQLKSQYGALSSLEKDVAKRATVVGRQTGKGLGDYAQAFSGGDMVNGILSLNPGLFAKGAAQHLFLDRLNYLKSPEHAIKSMFNSAQGTTLGAKVGSAVGDLGNKTMKDVPMGLSTKADTSPETTPESVGKNIDSNDRQIINDYLNKPTDLNAYQKAQPVINAMGIDKLSEKDREGFLKEVLNNAGQARDKSGRFAK